MAELLQGKGEGDRLYLAGAGAWTAANAQTLETLVNLAARRGAAARRVEIDMRAVERLDTFGAWLLERLRREPPDVVHLHSPNPTMLLALAARPPPSTLVITHHSDVVKQKLLRHALRPF